MVITPIRNSLSPKGIALALRALAILLVTVIPTSARPPQNRLGIPADRNASPATEKLLSYLAKLPGRMDKRVFSGQLVFYASKSNFPQWWDDILQQTEHTPGLMHVDNRCEKMCSIGGAPPEVLQKLISHWRTGGLVMLSAHHGNPATGGSPKDTNFSSEGFNHLLSPGDPVNSAYLAELDVIAQQLQTLGDAGVVVLYRPLLEMNGDWYWWSKGKTSQYVKLWRMEFDYLTQKKGLHNLLFVWAPNGESGFYSEYYPGNAYVDITALDFYQAIHHSPVPKIDGYKAITEHIARSKPFGIAEFGPLDPDTQEFMPEDYYQLIVGIKKNMPKTVFWSSHWNIWSMGLANPPNDRHLNVSKLLSDPWVINESDVNFSDSSAPATVPKP